MEYKKGRLDMPEKDKIIDLMAETIIEDTDKLGTFWCTGCGNPCEYDTIKDCVIKFFEKEAKKEVKN